MSDADTGASVSSRLRRYRVNAPKIQKLSLAICQHLGLEGHKLDIEFVSAGRIRRLNREFRGKDRSTDVLSFPQKEWEEPQGFATPRRERGKSKPQPPELLGDLVISLTDAGRNARQIGQPLDREVCFLMVHGILHLAGHDHIEPTEEQRMLAVQRKIMRILDADRKLWRNCVAVSPIGPGRQRTTAKPLTTKRAKTKSAAKAALNAKSKKRVR